MFRINGLFGAGVRAGLATLSLGALAACGGGAASPPGNLAGAGGSGASSQSLRSAVAGTRAADAFGHVVTGAFAPAISNAGALPIQYPIGLAVDADDELYIGNHANSAGEILVYSAKNVQIPAKTITKGLANPAGLAFDKAGNLYEADYTQQAVNVYDKLGKQIPNRTLKTDPNFNPSGVQIDRHGNVWVAMRTNNNIGIGEIEIFNAKGKLLHTITQGLVYPLGISFSAKTGLAWVCNAESPNDSITTYNEQGNLVNTFPTPGFTPTYGAFDKQGTFYATNALGSTVEYFTQSGQSLGTIANGFNAPYGIAFNSKGDFYVANVNASVNEYSSTGTLLQILK